ncbi:MAG TPA: hypothetical protein VL769_05900 [Acidimicrobiia bacterium]|nr:hypothetical protein [Acidimicrobiia bacterium]
MDMQAPDEETMVKVAVADLDDRFESIDRSKIETTVRRLVHELFARSRVKSFVGILAERRARAELRRIAFEPTHREARDRD